MYAGGGGRAVAAYTPLPGPSAPGRSSSPGGPTGAFVAAPITSQTPVIGAGYVAAFAQTYFRPPLVSELRSVMADMRSPRKWWSNRLLRIFLVFFLTNLGSTIGTVVGGAQIFSNL